jgi:hypothetical protein
MGRWVHRPKDMFGCMNTGHEEFITAFRYVGDFDLGCVQVSDL